MLASFDAAVVAMSSSRTTLSVTDDDSADKSCYPRKILLPSLPRELVQRTRSSITIEPARGGQFVSTMRFGRSRRATKSQGIERCARFPVHQYTICVPSKRSKFSEVTFDFTLNEQRLGTRETRSQLSKWRDEPRATSQKFTELAGASKFDSMGSTKDVCDDVRISRRATGIVVRSRDRELDGRAPRLKLATSWRETTSFDFVSARFSFLSCYEVAGP